MNADLLFSGNQYYNPRKAAKRRLRRGLPYWARLVSISVIMAALLLSGCSKQMPCPKIPKQKQKDSSFKPAAEGEGDETNNPTDNKANMTFGGGGIKRGKDGLVKKGKFKNLMSKNAKMRNYTKIKAPGGHDKTNRNYTDIANPGENKKARPNYTKINRPGGGDNVNRNYTTVDAPTKKGKRNKYTDINKPAGAKNKKGRKAKNVNAPVGTGKN